MSLQEERVGFVGLGVMGRPMAGHLIRNGVPLTVWNRTESKCAPLVELGAKKATSLEELGETCTLVAMCVSKTEDVKACVAALTARAKPGLLIVDHSTISPVAAAELFGRLAEQGIGFVDAPMTGGSVGAERGQLTIFCGGEPDMFERAVPMIGCYAKRVERVGAPGAGQMMKMANQIAVAGSLLGLCEALSFARKAGLNVAQTRELVGSGAAGSWAFENYGPKILLEDWNPGFSIDNQVKDLHYCVEAAEGIGAAVPGTRLVDRLLQALQEEGHGDWTTAALYRKLLELGPDA